MDPAGRRPRRSGVHLQRLAVLPLVIIRVAQLPERVPRVPDDDERLFELPNGVIVAAAVEKHLAEALLVVSDAGALEHRQPLLCYGFIASAQALRELPKLVVSVGVVRVQLEGTPKRSLRRRPVAVEPHAEEPER